MPEAPPIGKTTFEDFRAQVASTAPTPAGASVSAISASLGCALIEKVLRIAGHRKSFSGDRDALESTADAAHDASMRLAHLADQDAAAYEQYLASKRLKDEDALAAALRRAIEIPLQIAREAVGGLGLCEIASGLIHQAVAADLGTAVILLAGAARGTLLSVDSNLTLIPPDSQFYREILAERDALYQQAIRKSNVP